MLIILPLLLFANPAGNGVTILDSEGDTVTFQDMMAALSTYDAVFVGEEHDSKQAHEAELSIFQSLFGLDSTVVLGLEMFERDVQKDLDLYLSSAIDESTFVAVSRPWSNYESDYKPLVEFAKLNEIPVVAANVPRRAASAVAKAGEITPGVLGPDSIYMPASLYLDSKEYHDRILETMQGMPKSGPMAAMMVDGLFKAQVLKDAVMADALLPLLDQGRKVIFFCGRFHSDYRLGIPYQLAKNRPDLKIAVVTLAPAAEVFNPENRSKIADYVWFYE